MSKERQLDELFARAKSAPVVASFDETKAELLKSLAAAGTISFSAKLKAFLNLKNGIIMLSIASIVSIGVWIFISNPSKPVRKPELSEHTSHIVQPEKSSIEQTKEVVRKTTIKKKKQDVNFNLPVASITIQRFEDNMRAGIQLPLSKPVQRGFVPAPRPYFPTLTEKEIAANHKQKKKMVKALAKVDSKVYSYIPAGSFDYKGQIVSVQSYFMQQNEVTNLEYRTFLFDLLIQGRKDEFLIARPDQAQWVKILGDGLQPMQDMYFSHEAYNDYPVVNVSRKGAEMYCEWLTKETKATLKEGELMNDVRIPTRIEWVKAASNEGKDLPFPWTTKNVQNESNCYLANFDTSTYPEQASCEAMETKGSDGALLTAKTGTYNPNNYGLYNMSGNVAEMVYNAKIGDKGFQMKWDGNGTAGGSWMNTVEEIKIYGPDPYKDVVDAHPGIGFRVVMTHLSNKKVTPID